MVHVNSFAVWVNCFNGRVKPSIVDMKKELRIHNKKKLERGKQRKSVQ